MNGELRILGPGSFPSALADKKVKQLRLLASAKLEGHRVEIIPLYETLKIHPKTGRRLVKKLINEGWQAQMENFCFSCVVKIKF